MSTDQVPVLQALVDGDEFKKEVDDVLKLFASSEERRHPQKGKGKLGFSDKVLAASMKSAFGDMLTGWCLEDFDGAVSKQVGADRLAALTVPDFFCLAAQRPQVGFENSCLAALKLNVQGTKQVFLWSFRAIGDHVRKLLGKVAQKKPVSSAATAQWIGAATSSQVAAMLEANQGPGVFYHACMGPGDLLYIPSGWVKLELPGQDDNISVRWTVLSTQEASAKWDDMMCCIADLTAMGKKNLALDCWHQRLDGLKKAILLTKVPLELPDLHHVFVVICFAGQGCRYGTADQRNKLQKHLLHISGVALDTMSIFQSLYSR